MRTYADLHLCPPLDDLDNARSMAGLLAELQVRLVGLVVPPERLTPLPAIVELFRTEGIDVAKRLNLRPRSKEELLRSLRRLRGKYELISVECSVPSVSRVAVRDRRVDLVHFAGREHSNMLRGKVAKTFRAAMEIRLSDLTSAPGLGAALHRLKREIETTVQGSTRVIGSTAASNPHELRSPRDIAAILTVIGLPLESALEAVSEVPLEIVKKNRLKLEQPQFMEGVRIVRRPAEK